jgi:hypothetical protein
VSDFYVEPAENVSFGDIFEAEFLHDVFLRADAVQLGTRDMVKKHGGGLMYAASFDRNREFVLGRGAQYRALLIADNCLVDRILAQGSADHRPQGRLLFAPLVEADTGDEIKDFGRFPLPDWPERLPSCIAELRRCFMVDAPAILEHRDDRMASLNEDAAAELEVRWNAYAARRGPLANARNAEKVAELAARSQGDAVEPDRELAQLIASALVAGWRLEGDSMERVADAYSENREGDSELAELEGALRELGERSTQAADCLSLKLRTDQ